MITKDNINTAEYLYLADQPGDSPSSYSKSGIKVTITTDSKIRNVPISTENTEYNALMEWVAAGNTITDNDPNP